jgi:hypothetical protein
MRPNRTFRYYINIRMFSVFFFKPISGPPWPPMYGNNIISNVYGFACRPRRGMLDTTLSDMFDITAIV